MEIVLEAESKIKNKLAKISSYYFIFDTNHNLFDYVDKNISQILGFKRKEITVEFYLSLIHPDDLHSILNHEVHLQKFLATLPSGKRKNYIFRSDFRLKNSAGNYIRILQESMIYELNKNGSIAKLIINHKNIVGLRLMDNCSLSFIGLDGEPSYFNVVNERSFTQDNDVILTKREMEILALLAEGLTNAEIAERLFISVHTVGTHRKNIFAKTDSSSVLELILYAQEKDWIKVRK